MAEFTEVIIGDGSAVLFRAECAKNCETLHELVDRRDDVGLMTIRALGEASCDRCSGQVATMFEGQMACAITTPDWMKKSNYKES